MVVINGTFSVWLPFLQSIIVARQLSQLFLSFIVSMNQLFGKTTAPSLIGTQMHFHLFVFFALKIILNLKLIQFEFAGNWQWNLSIWSLVLVWHTWIFCHLNNDYWKRKKQSNFLYGKNETNQISNALWKMALCKFHLSSMELAKAHYFQYLACLFNLKCLYFFLNQFFLYTQSTPCIIILGW